MIVSQIVTLISHNSHQVAHLIWNAFSSMINKAETLSEKTITQWTLTIEFAELQGMEEVTVSSETVPQVADTLTLSATEQQTDQSESMQQTLVEIKSATDNQSADNTNELVASISEECTGMPVVYVMNISYCSNQIYGLCP